MLLGLTTISHSGKKIDYQLLGLRHGSSQKQHVSRGSMQCLPFTRKRQSLKRYGHGYVHNMICIQLNI